MIGLAMIAGGSALLAWRPRLKDTNEALLVAMKYGNSLTATRLALELDVSFEKAEKIIRELVRSGIAEIDLDQKDPDQGITYKIKGL
jgi:predicted transcriptional regulator